MNIHIAVSILVYLSKAILIVAYLPTNKHGALDKESRILLQYYIYLAYDATQRCLIRFYSIVFQYVYRIIIASYTKTMR